jgi:tetratricopeptide (TPR) repeat protein
MRELLAARLIPVLAAVVAVILLAPTPAPGALLAPLRQAEAASIGGRADVALASLEQALYFEPGYSALHPLAAGLALDAGLPASALAHLQTAAEVLPRDPTWICQEGLALAMLGSRGAALDRWGEEAETCLRRPQIVRDWAQIAIADGDREEALEALARWREVEPANGQAHLRYGLALATRDPRAAIDALRIADELSVGGSLEANRVIAAILAASGEGDEAYTLASVGRVLGEIGEWRFAAWAFREALFLNPQYTVARAYYGLALDQAGGDGLIQLHLAALVSPTNPLPFFFLGLHWRARGDPTAALESLTTAAGLDPENPSIAAELAGALEDTGEVSAALSTLARAAELAPREPGFWSLLARLSFRHEVEIRRVGLPAARNAYVLAPDDPAICDDLGYGYYLAGDDILAQRFLTRAISLGPNLPLTQYHYGLLLVRQGETRAARAAFGAAARLDPGGEVGALAERASEALPSP